ncbi:MAG TPA: hypothetical protein VHR66_23515 [Gemmataceae bacterium]|jgi:hypothetical protein|nr:hypothetical protein [Gemmataceae bacterium]
MGQSVLTLKLPADVYERVRRAAKGMKQPMEMALAHIVAAATPSLDKVPPEYRAELEALEDLGDDDLWSKAESRLPAATERRLTNLLDKNQCGKLTEHERQTLIGLRAADRLMLQRSYDYLLLKYRGHRIPNIGDLPR